MLGLLSDKDNKDPFVYDQAVIIDVAFSGQETLSSGEIYKAIKSLEEEIAGLLPDKSGIDGDEFTDDEATVYVYGPDADKIFMAIEAILKKSAFNHMNVTLQYGPPDDPATKDKKFTL